MDGWAFTLDLTFFPFLIIRAQSRPTRLASSQQRATALLLVRDPLVMQHDRSRHVGNRALIPFSAGRWLNIPIRDAQCLMVPYSPSGVSSVTLCAQSLAAPVTPHDLAPVMCLKAVYGPDRVFASVRVHVGIVQCRVIPSVSQSVVHSVGRAVR